MRSTVFAGTSAIAMLVALLVIGCSKGDQSSVSGPSSSPLNRALSEQTVSLAAAQGGNDERTRLEGSLTGVGTNWSASGRVRWEVRPDRTKFNTQVEDLRSSGMHEVKVNGVPVTSVNVSGGRGEVELDSRNENTIPKMVAGDLVEVFNPDNELVVRGTLQPD